MIVITAELGDGRYLLRVDGHENHAENGLVCAAVSAVAHTALLGLEQIAQHHPQHVTVTIKEKTP